MGSGVQTPSSVSAQLQIALSTDMPSLTHPESHSISHPLYDTFSSSNEH